MNARLCNPPAALVCPVRPKVAASAWIDTSNIGDLPSGLNADVPGGVRLRWRFPWDINGTLAPFPKSVVVRRGLIQEPRRIQAEFGMQPTSWAPFTAWTELRNISQGPAQIWALGPDACETVSAVTFTNSGRADVEVYVVLVGGATLAAGQVKAGKTFYFEGQSISRLIISGGGPIERPTGMNLQRGSFADVQMVDIARIDGCAALKATLVDVAKRLAVSTRRPFVTIKSSEWKEYQSLCDIVVNGVGADDRKSAYSLLDIALSTSWELAVLAGTGFIDGEGLDSAPFDAVDGKTRLKKSDLRYHVYEVEGTFADASGKEVSVLADPGIMGLTAPAVARPTLQIPKEPLVRRKSVVIGTGPGSGTPVSPIDDCVYVCEGHVNTVFSYGHDEVLELTPRVTRSQLAMRDPLPPKSRRFALGEARQGKPFVTWERTTIYREFDFQTEVPFVDSEVGLSVIARDCWDRQRGGISLAPVPLDLIYESVAPGLDTATCVSRDEIAQLALFNDTEERKLTELDLLLDSSLIVLERRNEDSPLSLDATIGAPSPEVDGLFSATITFASPVDIFQRSYLVGGRLIVGGFQATTKRFESRGNPAQDFVVFDPDMVCAQTQLYSTTGVGAEATLLESAESVRVWRRISEERLSAVVPSWPTLKPVKLLLDSVEKRNMLFNFTTMLECQFRHKVHSGPIAQPHVSAWYMAPPPDEPKACFALQYLGRDFYKRSSVRVQVEACEALDSHSRHGAAFADIFNIEKIQGEDELKKAFASARTFGEFRHQVAFERTTLFDVVSIAIPNPSGVALGVSSKNKDDLEGPIHVEVVGRILK